MWWLFFCLSNMPYQLSKTSLDKLVGVHPKLVAVVQRAIQISELDFKVLEGVRSKQRQAQLVASGASKTLDGRHITGHAVDLGAVVGGVVRWDWPLYYKIAEAMQQAAKELQTTIVWGGVWDAPLASIGDTEDAVAAYVARRKAAGNKAFIDGPHFELDKRVYP